MPDRLPSRVLLAAWLFCVYVPVALASPTITTVDSTGDVGWFNSIAIGTDNYPVISYYDQTNLDLKVASVRFWVSGV